MKYILHETPAGYALFKVNNDAILEAKDNEQFNKIVKGEDINSIVTLDYLFKFEKTEQAIEECQAINDGYRQ